MAMMTGTLCDELTPTAKAHDEPFLAGMMSQLGRMLTEFYFPEEATLIRRRVEPAWQRGEWTQAIEDRAVAEVLGLSYEQLGVGVTKVWGLPDSLRRAIARPEGAPPARAIDCGPRAAALVRAGVVRARADADAGAGRGRRREDRPRIGDRYLARAEPAQGAVRDGACAVRSRTCSRCPMRWAST